MSLDYDKKLTPLAKALRKNATPQERRLWYDFLRTYPIRFQRQKAIGRYIADFYCHQARLVIELDGSQHYRPDGVSHDAARSDALQAQGVCVLRFTNQEIDSQFQAVCTSIDQAVHARL